MKTNKPVPKKACGSNTPFLLPYFIQVKLQDIPEVELVTGEAIANDIITQLVKWQLDPQGAMAGRSRGASTRIMPKHYTQHIG